MKKIEEIDKNFLVNSKITRENIKIYDVRNEPFSIHGIFPTDNQSDTYYRLPAAVAAKTNEGVVGLATHCAGGRVRFKTNSPYIAVKANMGAVGKMPHFALTGSAGFDLHCGREHIFTFQPQFDITDEFFGERIVGGSELREYTLNLPLYSEVKDLYIILDEDAVVEAADPYVNKKPVVYYGSSITQGACASRPGTPYFSIISRNLNLEYINLGFSGSAKGEKAMAEYIAGLDMLAFVFDYDHNAPSVEHLGETHRPFFEIIREAHPEVPVICISQPFPCMASPEERKQIIKQTVADAKNNGDENVYYIDMSEYLKEKDVLDIGSVDKCHPNDLGFYYMAQAVEDVLNEII